MGWKGGRNDDGHGIKEGWLERKEDSTGMLHAYLWVGVDVNTRAWAVAQLGVKLLAVAPGLEIYQERSTSRDLPGEIYQERSTSRDLPGFYD